MSGDTEWIDFQMCPAPGCCMCADHGGDHWQGVAYAEPNACPRDQENPACTKVTPTPASSAGDSPRTTSSATPTANSTARGAIAPATLMAPAAATGRAAPAADEPYACRCTTPDVDTDGACCTCRRLVVTSGVAAKHGVSRCDSCGEYTIDLHRVARRNGHAYWCWDCWGIWAEEAAS